MPKEYWVKTDGKVRGPFSAAQLKKLAVTGKLHKQHEISSDKQNWIPAEKVNGLSFSTNETSGSASRSNVETKLYSEPSQEALTKEILIGSSFTSLYKWGLLLFSVARVGLLLLVAYTLFFEHFLLGGNLARLFSIPAKGQLLFAVPTCAFALMAFSWLGYVLLQIVQRLRHGKPIRERYFLLLYEDSDPGVRVDQMGALSKHKTFTRKGISSLSISRVWEEYVLELNCRDGSIIRLLGTVSKSKLQRRVNLIQEVIDIPVTEGPSYAHRLGRLFSSTSQTSVATPAPEVPQASNAKDAKELGQVVESSGVADESADNAFLKDALTEEPIPEPADWMPPVLMFYARVLPRTLVIAAVVFAIVVTVWNIQRPKVDYLRLLSGVLGSGFFVVIFYPALSSTSQKFLAGDKNALIAFHIIFGLLLLFGGAFWATAFMDGRIAQGVVVMLVQAVLLGPYFWYVAKCEKRFQLREDEVK